MMADDAHRPITAIVYADGAAFEAILDETVRNIAARGLRLAGVIQQSVARPGRQKCDMMLRDLATGRLHPISEHRGEAARGCALDVDLLLRACAAAEAGLTEGAALVVLSKFGKIECEGSGVRGLIEAALERGIPVMIGVPAINLQPFRAYAGDLARLVPVQHLHPGLLEETLAREVC
jgi:nucleoside-triphosphatase THEP1